MASNMMTTSSWVQNPERRGGDACIRNTRIMLASLAPTLRLSTKPH